MIDADKLNKWLSLAANIGVLAGIVFLAFEIQQANRIAIATTELDVRESNNLINLQSLDRDVAQLLSKVRTADSELSPVEEEMAFGFVYLYVNNWLAVETAFRRGMVPESTFELAKDEIPGLVPIYPGLLPYWQSVFSEYPTIDEYELLGLLRQTVDAQTP